jgi:hypothetical protein
MTLSEVASTPAGAVVIVGAAVVGAYALDAGVRWYCRWGRRRH